MKRVRREGQFQLVQPAYMENKNKSEIVRPRAWGGRGTLSSEERTSLDKADVGDARRRKDSSSWGAGTLAWVLGLTLSQQAKRIG